MDFPSDGGGVIGVYWRAKNDSSLRFWRVEIQQVGLPDPETGEMQVVDGPVNHPRPASALSTDYTGADNLLWKEEGPFWCWPPVEDTFKDMHWLAVDLALHFPPKELDERLRLKRDEIAKAKDAKAPPAEPGLQEIAKAPPPDPERVGPAKAEDPRAPPTGPKRVGPAKAKDAKALPAGLERQSRELRASWEAGHARELRKLERELRELGLARDRELARIRRGRYRVTLLYQDEGMSRLEPIPAGQVEVEARPDWLDATKLNSLVFAGLLCAVILLFIARARRQKLFLRRIPGVDAVEEAIGRGTEMGRPIYFLTGRLSITSVSTMAAATILGEVARKVAQYDTPLKVPHTDAITMSVCQEITREAYQAAGRPDAFQEDANFYVTDEQFSYTAAVDGMMMREKPAACFYMGYYYAEALMLAETGTAAGAIQIAGTDAEHQLPFFVSACDYTLMGEELYAASAYLSQEPVKVGTLRGQDAGKLALMAFLLFGSLLVTVLSLSKKREVLELVPKVTHLFKAF